MDTPEGLLMVMERLGIDKALVYNPYGVTYDSVEGNREILKTVEGFSGLVPQFVANFPAELFEDFKEGVKDKGIKSLRAYPKTHTYPFVSWMVGDWMEWMEDEGIALWLPIDEVDMKDLYEMARAHPAINIVLVGVHYTHQIVVFGMMEHLPNLYVELSRYYVMEPVERFVSRFGSQRLIFGSGFPEMDGGAYLYYLNNCGLSDDVLRAICRDNLEVLLNGD